MKVYFLAVEGGKWHTLDTTRKDLNDYLKVFSRHSTLFKRASVCAIRVGKSNIIYDFVLLSMHNKPWIRTYEPVAQEQFMRNVYHVNR